MRIGIDGRGFVQQRTGMEQFAFYLYQMLPFLNRKHLYFAYHRDSSHILPPARNANFHHKTLKVPKKPFSWLWAFLWEQGRVPQSAQKDQVDIYHGIFNTLPLWGSFKKVVTLHDLTPFLFPQWHTSATRVQAQLLTRLSVKKADAVLVPSRCTHEDAMKTLKISEKKLIMIPEAPGPEFKPSSEQNRKVLAEKYGLTKNFILFVGTIQPRKNISRLLLAFEQMKDQSNLPHTLVLVGKTGWKTQQIFKTLQRIKHGKEVHFLNHVPSEELPVFFSFCDVFVYPSLYEGFGLPVIEAMACGAPVAASASSSLPEVGGDAALYFNPGNTAEITRSMLTVIQDNALKNQLKEKSLAQASRFSWKKTAEKTLEVFESVLTQ